MNKNLINFIKSFQKEEETVIKDLQGYCILVTGASKGIGFTLAKTLYNLGSCLILLSRSIKENNELQKWDKKRVLILSCDITDENQVRKAIAQSLKKFGKIDVLVNNAGIFDNKPLDKTSKRDFETILNTNLKGIFLMSKNVIPAMKKAKNGLIINMGSKISHNSKVDPNKVLYAAAKYAVEGFSYALNRELKTFGIRVVCLMPATVNTFLTLNPKKFLSQSDVVSVILIVIYFKNIDFEGIVFKSRFQDL